MIALGMRRPERLRKLDTQPALPAEEDFGIDIMLSPYTRNIRKRKEVKLFLQLCKLSIIMEEVAVFQRNIQYSKIWHTTGRELTQEEVDVVIALEVKLRTWKNDLNCVVGNNLRRRYMRDGIPMSYILQIMGE